jgi:hypothetical protein
MIQHRRSRHAEFRAGVPARARRCREPRRGRTDRRSGSRRVPRQDCAANQRTRRPGHSRPAHHAGHRHLLRPPLLPQRRCEVPHIAWSGLPVGSVNEQPEEEPSRDDTLRWSLTKTERAGDSRNTRPIMRPGTGATTAAPGRPCLGVGTSISSVPGRGLKCAELGHPDTTTIALGQ